jgi:hypothetical protein
MYFAAGVYLSEAQKPKPHPPPLTHCIRIYSILRGGGEFNQRAG